MKWLIPPLLIILLIVLMVILNWLSLGAEMVPSPYNHMGWFLIVIGLVSAQWEKVRFAKAETTFWTFDNPDKMITDGLFRFSRNPMYLGLGLLTIGAALVSNNYLSLFLVGVYFVTAQLWYIPFEEERMREKFGDEFLEYCQKIRRWL
jgi:protein-S-isoprenylcysteine O-methyltransferase Ste14